MEQLASRPAHVHAQLASRLLVTMVGWMSDGPARALHGTCLCGEREKVTVEEKGTTSPFERSRPSKRSLSNPRAGGATIERGPWIGNL